MTDITRKLEILANLKPGDLWPSADLGGDDFNYIPAINALCNEALAEIRRLRAHERASERWLAELDVRGRLFPPNSVAVSVPVSKPYQAYYGRTATQVIIDDPHVSYSGSLRPPTNKPMSNQDMTFVAAHMPLRPGTMCKQGCTCGCAPEREQAERTLADAWGSAYAMNTENWK